MAFVVYLALLFYLQLIVYGNRFVAIRECTERCGRKLDDEMLKEITDDPVKALVARKPKNLPISVLEDSDKIVSSKILFERKKEPPMDPVIALLNDKTKLSKKELESKARNKNTSISKFDQLKDKLTDPILALLQEWKPKTVVTPFTTDVKIEHESKTLPPTPSTVLPGDLEDPNVRKRPHIFPENIPTGEHETQALMSSCLQNCFKIGYN